jgi:hypothetical protein
MRGKSTSCFRTTGRIVKGKFSIYQRAFFLFTKTGNVGVYGYTTSRPKAFVNWILFDEQFKYISSSSGSEQVGADNTLTVHQQSNLPVAKNRLSLCVRL